MAALKRHVVKRYERAVRDGVITRAEADAQMLRMIFRQDQNEVAARQGQNPPSGR